MSSLDFLFVLVFLFFIFFFFSSRRRHTRSLRDWSSDVCSSDLIFDRDPEIIADVLYVAGGVYGNPCALDAIEAMATRESGRVAVVLNGDFHWRSEERRVGKECRARWSTYK